MTPGTAARFVSVVVPTFQKPGPLKQTLSTLMSVDYPDDRYEIIVVDDGSSDETHAVAERFARDRPLLTYVHQPNAGAARARNQGALRASGEVLIFVDDDMLVPSDLIHRHLEALDFFEPAVICGYHEFSPDLATELRATPFGRFRLEVAPRQEWGPISVDAGGRFPANCRSHTEGGMTACNLAVRREDLMRIGGFDEQFPHAGYEDQEFALRASQVGYDCRIHYGLRAWHNDGRLTLKEFLERQRRGARTAVLFAMKYPDRLGQTLFRENARLENSVRLSIRIKRGVKRFLATAVGRAGLFGAVVLLERFNPDGRALPRLYTLLTGVYIFAGIQQGFAHYGRGRAGRHTAVLLGEATRADSG